MRIDRVQSVLFVFALAAGIAFGVPDPTDHALREAGMLDVLEARLLSRLDGSRGGDSRSETISQLASVYREMIDLAEEGTPERERIVARAWALADRAGPEQATDLRLALLINAYVPIERDVALYEVGLLSDEQHSRRAIELSAVHRKLRAIAGSAVPDAVRDERLARNSDDPETVARARESSRLRSFSSYYAAWSGLMLSILEDRRPGSDVLPAFGWLLAAEGGQPRLDDVRDSAFELEHVARSAIGVARARHRSGETVLAMLWLEKVIDSAYAIDPIREQASLRRLRFLAQDRSWSELLVGFYELLGSGSERVALPSGEARFHAIRAMDAIEQGTRSPDTEAIASLALGDLVRRGEIGHVLDLRERYGSLPMLSDGFVGRYADALDRLEAAEASASTARYLDAASAFERAAAADDANRFARQRDDAQLKSVYCLVRGGRPTQAIQAASELIGRSLPMEAVAQAEARWLLIVAIESSGDARRRDALRAAVRDYLARYRGSQRAMMLLVRHAGTDLLEPGEGLDGLRSVQASDPIAVDAKRVLVRLLYGDWLESGRTDRASRAEIVESVGWIWSQESEDSGARERFDVARIAADVGLGGRPRLTDLAAGGLERAAAAMSDDPALGRHEPDILLLRVELLSAIGRLDEAEQTADLLRQAADVRAGRADRIMLAAAFASA
ncbi:MAG: hypothetical protein AAGA55_10500, partial [Planctomycetota bacterium]